MRAESYLVFPGILSIIVPTHFQVKHYIVIGTSYPSKIQEIRNVGDTLWHKGYVSVIYEKFMI